MTGLRLPLTSPRLGTPEEVIRWLGVVQAQDYGPAKWSIAQRMDGSITDAALDEAFDAGRILRTHVLRPTWHFILPEDIRWLVALTGPRIQALSAFMYRSNGLDAAVRARSNDIIARALEGGRHLTRAQLRTKLDAEGIPTAGFRIGYLMIHAEVSLLVCSGPRSGTAHTYALLEERAPQARRPDPDASLAELTRRYFTSHGPATVKDFRVWCSLTAGDARRGLELAASDLVQETWRDIAFWSRAGSSDRSVTPEPTPAVHLLQGYDEFIMGFTETKALIDLGGSAGYSPTDRAIYVGVVLLDGQFVGNWKRTVTRNGVIVHVQLTRPFGADEQQALQAAAERYGAFLDRPTSLVVVD